MRTAVLGDRVVPRIVTTLLWIWVAFNIALVAWVFLGSVKPNGEFFDAWPSTITFDNFARAWEYQKFGSALVNTVWVAVAGAGLSVLLAAPAAYVLSRSERRSSGPLTAYLALGMSVPHQAVLVPYVYLNAETSRFMIDWVTGWWDPRILLVLIYAVWSLPFTVFVLTGFFRGLPAELEEAAALDGATGLQTFTRVMLPMAWSGLKTVFVLNLITCWNETLLVLVLVPDHEQRTLGATLLGTFQNMQHSGDWSGLFAGIVIVVAPMLALYVWLGRRIVEGMTAGMGK